MDPLNWLRDTAPSKRWFADKRREISGVDIIWRTELPGDATVQLIVARYDFSDGDPSLYFVPLDLDSSDEATDHAEFTHWLLASLRSVEPLPPGLAWARLDDADLTAELGTQGRILAVEQSNTSIRYGERTMIKLNRRLTAGPSPEAELSAVIAKANDPSFAAATHGVLTISGIADSPVCIAICSAFVPNIGDAWGYLQARMTQPADPEGTVGSEVDAIADATAAMHKGLISDPWRSDVAPEPITRDDIMAWQRNGLAAFDRLERYLAGHIESLPERTQELARLLPSSADFVRRQLGGYEALSGTHKIRIHGDYHLAQLLRKPQGGYVVVDFDGEPNRSLAERRAKYSALRDVAAMLRSFAYARGTAEQANSRGERSAEWMAWEATVRARFLSRYRSTLGAPSVPLLPNSSDDLRMAITALELEKAIYECGYELGNRPDWLWLPLSRLVRAA